MNHHPHFINFFNFIGFVSLYKKECKRFLNVYSQTVIAPVITTLLFWFVFVMALGKNTIIVQGYNFSSFLLPGLIIMTMAQNAFANTSSSLVVAKIQGNIVDILMAPLTSFEMILAYMLGGITRGLLVGLITYICLLYFVPIIPYHIGYVIIFGVLGSAMLALLGILGGIWSQKFDHIAAVTNFVITPLSFLSGTFYTLDRLPEFFQKITYYNPFFYMIDGFRLGFLGFNDVSPLLGIAVLCAVNIFLFWVAFLMLEKGYKIKS